MCFWWAFSGEAGPASVGKIADWIQLLQQEALQLQGNAQRSGNSVPRKAHEVARLQAGEASAAPLPLPAPDAVLQCSKESMLTG